MPQKISDEMSDNENIPLLDLFFSTSLYYTTNGLLNNWLKSLAFFSLNFTANIYGLAKCSFAIFSILLPLGF